MKNHQNKRVQPEGYKQESRIYSACLSPESVAIHHVHLAGLLACFLFTAFPSRLRRDSGCSVNIFPAKDGMKLTATGIAPVSHRTSLLTPTALRGVGDQILQM